MLFRSVVAWLLDGRVELTQRLDLPAGPEDLGAWMRALWGHPLAGRADEAIVAFVTRREPEPAVLAGILNEAGHRGCTVRDALLVREGSWRSLLCRDADCCPPEGRHPEPSTADAVRAEFAVLGRAPLASRTALEQQLDRKSTRLNSSH